jgi:serine/threonine-protein kinase
LLPKAAGASFNLQMNRRSTMKLRVALWWGGTLLLAVLVMDQFVMPAFVRRGEEFPLPDVTSLSMEDARARLEELGLVLQLAGSEYSPARLEGTVLSQEPPAGTLVKTGRPVAVVISKGSEMVRVPYLVGVTVRQAHLTLSDLGLVPGDIDWGYSDSLPPEVVLESNPGAGTLIAKGGRVALVVNQGGVQDTLAMPNLVGMALEQAGAQLTSLGLELGVTIRQYSKDLIPGTVLEQSEPPGTFVKRGDVIDVVVAAKESDI